ncbi:MULTISPECIES: nucleotide exchange factor GrpE [Methylobacterium]|jgi:molecular chaperone GrpE|nr:MULTISPECIES: nucleotide exchange factor GrpE [Methylobacterium]
MTSNDMSQDDQRQTTVEAGASAAQDTAPAGKPAEGASVDPVAEALALLTAERDELKDRMLRTLAEMENLRRRTEREIADARAYAVTNFARDVLNVADNIHRALESVPADAKASADGALKGLIDGIELTQRDLVKTLERHGVKPVEPQGQKFDPNRHQAMFEVPNPDVPAGTVVQVVQTGYVIGERVLRPALVGVAKGGPKAAANPADAA